MVCGIPTIKLKAGIDRGRFPRDTVNLCISRQLSGYHVLQMIVFGKLTLAIFKRLVIRTIFLLIPNERFPLNVDILLFDVPVCADVPPLQSLGDIL